MKNNPLVTIVTATYNLIKNDRKEAFIRALESVRNQTYKNIEHIVIDGASDDGTVELIKEYSDKSWIKYISEPDTGLYDAMNKGAMLAKGEYILFLNSDDYYSGEKGIEKSIEAIEKTNADYSYTDCKIMNADGSRNKSHLHNKPDFSKIFTDMPFCHQTLMVKTNIFRELGMFDLTYKSAGDYEFVLRLVFNKFKHAYIPYEFATFKMGGYSHQNIELSINEVSSFYQKHYSNFYNLSFERARNIYLLKSLPSKLFIKLLPYMDDKEKVKSIFYKIKQKTGKIYYNGLKLNFSFIKKIRRKILRFRVSKKSPSLKIFGANIIKS